jgi:phospholipid transport system substrate-binding protein
LLRKGFNLEYIGRFVLGTTWRRATPEQRTDYLDLFGEFVVKTYAKRLGGYSGEALTVLKTTVVGKKRDVIVYTRIDRPSGPPLKATWRVRKFDDQDKIIDVTVEGVSMAVTQRQEFASVTRRSGLEGLLQILRARTERLPAARSQ